MTTGFDYIPEVLNNRNFTAVETETVLRRYTGE